MRVRHAGPTRTATTRHRLPQINFPFSQRDPHAPQRYRTYGADPNLQLIKTLGWFSIGLGVLQLLAPRTMSRLIGVSGRPLLMRAVGARGIAAGAGLLSQRQAAPWLWTRVAGDAMDLTLLGVAAGRSTSVLRSRVGIATAAVAGVTLLDVLSSVQHARAVRSLPRSQWNHAPLRIEKAIGVSNSPEQCYRYWRDFQNFPRFMKHVESVQAIDGNRWRWKSRSPIGASMQWDAEIIADRPGELLAWRTVEGSGEEHGGTVRFEPAPDGRGTMLRVDFQYSPPRGMAGAWIARVFGADPAAQIDDDLRRFKWLIETGELPSDAAASGTRETISRLLFGKGESASGSGDVKASRVEE
ncbi:SRPBCC family protein [Noviherbaspirillum cavernae]|uniref:SRPBCC family protein n=1 Tax=Noviherbaspirillum cavernae TaxID=2320862 RepID=A0A418X4P2_9BURK|nr:SRPBCC family protein [Noviherbaspirillum cavernae]RJG07442.1 SRPBCC family protein [Noviherbaspirillum cavernae]